MSPRAGQSLLSFRVWCYLVGDEHQRPYFAPRTSSLRTCFSPVATERPNPQPTNIGKSWRQHGEEHCRTDKGPRWEWLRRQTHGVVVGRQSTDSRQLQTEAQLTRINRNRRELPRELSPLGGRSRFRRPRPIEPMAVRVAIVHYEPRRGGRCVPGAQCECLARLHGWSTQAAVFIDDQLLITGTQ